MNGPFFIAFLPNLIVALNVRRTRKRVQSRIVGIGSVEGQVDVITHPTNVGYGKYHRVDGFIPNVSDGTFDGEVIRRVSARLRYVLTQDVEAGLVGIVGADA